jgi:hypothetical protein
VRSLLQVTDLTADRLREVLDYDPETGVFRWKVSACGLAGQEAGSTNGLGYLRIRVDGKRYVASRLAWLYVHGRWPSDRIDHRDRQRARNPIENLRESTRVQNKANQTRRKDNLTGFKGVHKVGARYQARFGPKAKHLGLFATPEEAHARYVREATEQWGDFASGG